MPINDPDIQYLSSCQMYASYLFVGSIKNILREKF